MKARKDHPTAERGAYCPVPPAELRERRMRSGKYLLTRLGLELYCAGCEQYWPADTEFYAPAPARPDGLQTWCRACYSEWRCEHPRQRSKAA